MTDVTVTIDTDGEEQITEPRAEYVDGDIGEEELERRVKEALENGPPIGTDQTAALGEKSTGIERLGELCAAPMIQAFLWLAYRNKDDYTCKYDSRTHTFTGISHNPDPDDHPAEGAGKMQTILSLLPVTYYGLFAAMLTVGAGDPGWQVAAGSVLFVVTMLQYFVDSPTAKVTTEGVGTHVAD